MKDRMNFILRYGGFATMWRNLGEIGRQEEIAVLSEQPFSGAYNIGYYGVR